MEDESLSIDDLIATARREARLEVQAETKAEEAEQARLRAAFEAGAPLVTQVPIDLYDPIDNAVVQVPGSTVLTVAEHQGDILVGRLIDNSHSLGVVYEEPHRWTPRKYFLSLSALVDEAKIHTDDAEAHADFDASRAKGLDHSGEDAATQVAVRSIEDLLLRDERAVLPRGVALMLRSGGVARDPQNDRSVTLAPGTRATVVKAVDDFDLEDGPPEISVEVDGRPLRLSYDVLDDLDPKADVLSARDVEALEQAMLDRRQLMRRVGGVGAAAVVLGADTAWYLNDARRGGPEDERLKRQVLSALAPQLAALVGYFGAGGKYWYELRGKLMDLRELDCMRSVRPLATALAHSSRHAARLWNAYSESFYRTVHTGWSETKHYRTDSEGKQHYTHSTWSKTYSTYWVESDRLTGRHAQVERWSEGDAHREDRGQRLLSERIFQLLETAPGDAEGDFHLHRHGVSFARDATISALSAAICTLPAAFWDDFVAWVSGRHAPPPGPVRLQKPALLMLGAVAGIVLAHRQRNQLQATMRQNKYDMGQQLEMELGRVPSLDLDEAWIEFFGPPGPDALPQDLAERAGESDFIARNAESFSYTHGSGWDNGRSLDSIYVDAGPVQVAFSSAVREWPVVANELGRITGAPAHRERLLPVLRNAVGTEVLDAQMQEDEGEAKGGMWKSGLIFAAPLWGAMVIDVATKWKRW